MDSSKITITIGTQNIETDPYISPEVEELFSTHYNELLTPELLGYNMLYSKGETFEEYWERLKDCSICTFCGTEGHSKKECPTLKQNMCLVCGFFGHTPKKCNKIKKGPNGI